MSKGESDEHIDADILQCKADILRARDMIPQSKKKSGEESKSQEITEDTCESAEAVEITVEKEETVREGKSPISLEPADAVKERQEQTEIPRFDLAEEIMAEQRKITAIRRKAPGKKAEEQEPQAQRADYSIEPPPAQADRMQIVAEIVARDIKRLCVGDG